MVKCNSIKNGYSLNLKCTKHYIYSKALLYFCAEEKLLYTPSLPSKLLRIADSTNISHKEIRNIVFLFHKDYINLFIPSKYE